MKPTGTKAEKKEREKNAFEPFSFKPETFSHQKKKEKMVIYKKEIILINFCKISVSYV